MSYIPLALNVAAESLFVYLFFDVSYVVLSNQQIK